MAEAVVEIEEKKPTDVVYHCDYPMCDAWAPVHTKTKLNFCHTHYALYKFIKRIVKE